MCGIFGFLLNRPLTEGDIALGEAGTAALRHRGPDHSDVWMDRERGVFLGHNRLSIIDLSDGSNQPMVRDGAVLTYNGEIYNYRELREELSGSGFSPSTTGDVEVLLHSWHAWGAACVQHFDGMFAFALYDNGRMHLATDPFGEKPIYWAETKDGVYFASECNPLVDLLALPFEPSAHETAAFLCLGFLPSPATGYRGLFRMPPGTWLTFTSEGRPKQTTYWAPPEPRMYAGRLAPLSESDLDLIVEALVASLKVRLRADVPLGIFLSSGVDSALTAALAAKELHADSLALTVRFEDAEVNDESEAAAAIAISLGLPHQIVHSADDPARGDPHAILDLFGEPNDNVTVAAAYQMSLAATRTQGLKVALSGVGGDEVFYGYNKYQALFRWRRWLRVDQRLRRSAAALTEGLFPGRWAGFRRMMSAGDRARFVAAKNLPVWPWLAEVPQVVEWAQDFFAGYDGVPMELAGRHVDLVHTMPGSYIPGIERGSMRASLEVRTPFLSRGLIEVTSQFDQRAFLAFGQKSVLRRILARYLPSELFDHPKRGFNYPVGRFLEGFSATPRVPGLDRSKVDRAWREKSEPWQKLNARLAILSYFMSGAAQRTTTMAPELATLSDVH